MKIVILDSATLGEDIDLSPIYSAGEVTEHKSTTPDEVEKKLSFAEAVIVNKIKLGAHNLENAKALRLICVTATGYDNIDVEYCRSRGIALCNVPAYSTDSVAQVTAAMALSLASRLGEYTDFVNSGEYSASGLANRLTPVYHELSSMTWGVVGGGAIGSRVAEIAQAFGCNILMCRRKIDDRYRAVDIDTLCESSNIISLHVPLTEDTRGLISRERIAKMKKGAILINSARGAVADEEALTDAIERAHLGGLGIDVYSREPFGEEHPYTRILGRKNVLLTPHMAWGSAEARARCVAIIAQNVKNFEKGHFSNRIV
ncbi:MAG: hydroxyacid dehydrogenase [Clostridia bacterium]|nr:hydroxyacid dehydrogenase [Clostridia bacterium]